MKFLNRLLEAAVRAERIARNPARALTLPKAPARAERALTAAEVWKLADAVPDQWRAAILVMGFCGLRIGELAALRVSHIEFLRRRIRVEEQLVDVKGALHLGPPKSGKARAVPVPQVVLDELAEHIRKYPRTDGRLFGARAGTPLRRKHFRERVFVPAARACGLEPLRPHDLRHTAITIAIGAGAPLKAVQELAGHASAAMTADRYAHLLPSVADELADRMDAAARAGRESDAQPRTNRAAAGLLLEPDSDDAEKQRRRPSGLRL